MNTNHNRIKVADLETNQRDKVLVTNENGELNFKDISTLKIESYNALDYIQEGKSLDARQGKALKDLIDTINTLLLSDNVNLNNIQKLANAIEVVQNSLNTILVNDLITGGAAKALTAEQGKVLKGFIDALTSNKVDKVSGERLISATEITKLSGIEAGAQINQDISGKQDINNQIFINTSGLVQDSWHGKLVTFTASVTITIPAAGLRTGFNFEGIVDPGFTVNTSLTVPKIWSGGYTGSPIPENSIFSFIQRGNDSNKISIYGLL